MTVEKQSYRSLCILSALLCLFSLGVCAALFFYEVRDPRLDLLPRTAVMYAPLIYIRYQMARVLPAELTDGLRKPLMLCRNVLLFFLIAAMGGLLSSTLSPGLTEKIYACVFLPYIAIHFYGGCVLPWREMRRQS